MEISSDPPAREQAGGKGLDRIREEHVESSCRDLREAMPSLWKKISALKTVDECALVCHRLFRQQDGQTDRFRRQLDDARDVDLDGAHALVLRRIAASVDVHEIAALRSECLNYCSALLDLFLVVFGVNVPHWYKLDLWDPDSMTASFADLETRLERDLFPGFYPKRSSVDVVVKGEVAFFRVVIGDDPGSVTPTYIKYRLGKSEFFCDQAEPDELVLRAVGYSLTFRADDDHDDELMAEDPVADALPESVEEGRVISDSSLVTDVSVLPTKEGSEGPATESLRPTPTFSVLCESCNWSFSGGSNLSVSSQILKHSCNVTLKRCDFCGKSFLSERDLKLHVMRMHDSRKTKKQEKEKRKEAKKRRKFLKNKFPLETTEAAKNMPDMTEKEIAMEHSNEAEVLDQKVADKSNVKMHSKTRKAAASARETLVVSRLYEKLEEEDDALGLNEANF